MKLLKLHSCTKSDRLSGFFDAHWAKVQHNENRKKRRKRSIHARENRSKQAGNSRCRDYKAHADTSASAA
jgi:hypothetical protein